jgi:hypothetical protein
MKKKAAKTQPVKKKSTGKAAKPAKSVAKATQGAHKKGASKVKAKPQQKPSKAKKSVVVSQHKKAAKKSSLKTTQHSVKKLVSSVVQKVSKIKEKIVSPESKKSLKNSPAATEKLVSPPKGIQKNLKKGMPPKSLLEGTSLMPSHRTAAKILDSDICRETACEGLSTTAGYCRLHYIKNWKRIKRKELILAEKKLDQYIEELISKYPDKYVEAIRQDLGTEKEFSKVINDLELDESIDDFESEGDSETITESIRIETDDDDAF